MPYPKASLAQLFAIIRDAPSYFNVFILFISKVLSIITAILSLPNLSEASDTNSRLLSLFPSKIAFLAPVYMYFFTSSSLLILPPTSIGISTESAILIMALIFASCSLSFEEMSKTRSSSAPLLS